MSETKFRILVLKGLLVCISMLILLGESLLNELIFGVVKDGVRSINEDIAGAIKWLREQDGQDQ